MSSAQWQRLWGGCWACFAVAHLLVFYVCGCLLSMGSLSSHSGALAFIRTSRVLPRPLLCCSLWVWLFCSLDVASGLHLHSFAGYRYGEAANPGPDVGLALGTSNPRAFAVKKNIWWGLALAFGR